MKRIFVYGICFFCVLAGGGTVVLKAAKMSRAVDFLKLIDVHEVKRPPGPRDWMAMHPEPGQTFDDYIASRPVKPDQDKKYIYLTLLGDFDATRREIVEKAGRYMEAYFGLPVKKLDPIPLSLVPAQARRNHPVTQDAQILTSYVLEEILKPRVPKDAFCLIAFTPSDLWPGEGWNFVFGQASLEDRVGVWSIYRNGDPKKSREDYRLCLTRTVKTGTHEVGHMFSMHHCIFYECNMNGSNHRKESDQRPLWLCPVCLRKLHWATGKDVVQRYQDLIEVSQEMGFDAERSFFEESIKTLTRE